MINFNILSVFCVAAKGFDNKRRGRSKKSLDLLRNGPESTPSPSGLDGFPDGPLHPGFPFPPHDIRLRAGGEFGGGLGRLSPPLLHGHPDYFPEGWGSQEFAAAAAMGGYGPPGFRQPFCESEEQQQQQQAAMLERMGAAVPAHMAGMRPNGFPFHHPHHHRPPHPFSQGGGEPGYPPHSPLLPTASSSSEQFQQGGLPLSPHHHHHHQQQHHGGFPSPDPHGQQQQPVGATLK